MRFDCILILTINGFRTCWLDRFDCVTILGIYLIICRLKHFRGIDSILSKSKAMFIPCSLDNVSDINQRSVLLTIREEFSEFVGVLNSDIKGEKEFSH